MGRKELNPADVERKKDRKKQLKLCKEKRDVVRSVRELLSDPDKIEEDIQKAQKASDGNKLDTGLKDKIKELRMMKSVALGRQKLDIASGKFERDKAAQLREAELIQRQRAREGKGERTAYEPSLSSSSSAITDAEVEKKQDPFHPLSDQLNRPVSSITSEINRPVNSVLPPPFVPPPTFAYQPMSQEVQRAPVTVQRAPAPVQRAIAPMLSFDAPGGHSPRPPSEGPPIFRPPPPVPQTTAPGINLPKPLFAPVPAPPTYTGPQTTSESETIPSHFSDINANAEFTYTSNNHEGHQHEDSIRRDEDNEQKWAQWDTDGGRGPSIQTGRSDQDIIDQRRIEEIDRMIAEAERKDISSQFCVDTSEYETDGNYYDGGEQQDTEQFQHEGEDAYMEPTDSNIGLFSDEVDQDEEMMDDENNGQQYEVNEQQYEGEQKVENNGDEEVQHSWEGEGTVSSSSGYNYSHPIVERPVGPAFPSSSFNPADYALPSAEELMKRRLALSAESNTNDDIDDAPSYPSSAFSASDYTLPTAQEIMNRRFAVSHAKIKADEEKKERENSDNGEVAKKGIFMPPSYKSIPLPFAVSSGGLGGLAGYGSDSDDEDNNDKIATPGIEIPQFVPKGYPIAIDKKSLSTENNIPVYSHAPKPIEKIAVKQVPIQSYQPPAIQNRVEDDVAAFLASIENNEIESSSLVEYKGEKQGVTAAVTSSAPSEKPVLKAIKRDAALTAFRPSALRIKRPATAMSKVGAPKAPRINEDVDITASATNNQQSVSATGGVEDVYLNFLDEIEGLTG